jgi:hypothetical protein
MKVQSCGDLIIGYQALSAVRVSTELVDQGPAPDMRARRENS